MIVDIHGNEQAPSDAPSAMRGANFIYESMRVGPEESALHFMAQSADQRRSDLEDIAEFMRFTREWWNALDQCHLGLSAKDNPTPSDNPTEQG